jgi:hypothetical protein
MNRNEIMSQDRLRTRVAAIEREVALGRRNELAVRFTGQPSSEMLISIESRNWKRAAPLPTAD